MSDTVKNFCTKYRWIIVFLLMIPFFNDAYDGFQIVSDWTMDYLKIAVFLVLVYLLIFRKKRPSALMICLTVMEAWWLVTTLINYGFSDDTALHKTIIDIVNALSVSLIVECFRDDGKSLIDGLMLNFELTIYPNLVTVFLHHTLRGYYLLGYYAVLILWILPAICVGALYMIIHKKYIRGGLLIIASLITTVMIWCATITVAIMGMAALVIFCLLLYKIDRFKKIRVPLSLFIVLALLGNLFVLFVYSGGSFPLIDVFIEKFLGRSTSFTGRTPIWEKAIEMFLERPVIGYGFRPTVTRADGFVAMHAHNMILQRLTATGIIGLILFVVFHIILIFKMDKMENSIARIVMMGGVFAVNITYLMDAYKKFFRFYLVFFLAYHVDELIKKKISNTDYLNQ